MKSKITKDISLIAFFITLLIIGSWFTIPFVIPFTLQTLIIFTFIIILNLKQSLLIITIYLLLGFIGIPVFNSFQSGIGVFVGPTGGFLIGFIPMIIVSYLIKSFLLNKYNSNKKIYNVLLFTSLLTGLIVCYVVAILWYILIYDTSAKVFNTISILVLPFIIPDIIKIIISIIISERYHKITKG